MTGVTHKAQSSYIRGLGKFRNFKNVLNAQLWGGGQHRVRKFRVEPNSVIRRKYIITYNHCILVCYNSPFSIFFLFVKIMTRFFFLANKLFLGELKSIT